MRIAFLALAATAAIAAPKPRPELVVSTEWLARHLKDPRVVVLDVSRDRARYDQGHIPGARYVPWKELVVDRGGVVNELPPLEDLSRLFGRLGVASDSHVVLYGDMQGLSAARAFFTLDYLGHAKTSLLDGGLEKWQAEQRPLSKDASEPRPSGSSALQPRPKPEVVVNLDRMRDLSYAAASGPASGVVLVDARPAEVSQRGRIPGSRNVWWMNHLQSKENPVLKPAAELRKLYPGLPGGARIVTYCQSGIQASHSYFTLRYLGYDVRMYDGSFGEWSAAKDAPVER